MPSRRFGGAVTWKCFLAGGGYSFNNLCSLRDARPVLGNKKRMRMLNKQKLGDLLLEEVALSSNMMGLMHQGLSFP